MAIVLRVAAFLLVLMQATSTTPQATNTTRQADANITTTLQAEANITTTPQAEANITTTPQAKANIATTPQAEANTTTAITPSTIHGRLCCDDKEVMGEGGCVPHVATTPFDPPLPSSSSSSPTNTTANKSNITWTLAPLTCEANETVLVVQLEESDKAKNKLKLEGDLLVLRHKVMLVYVETEDFCVGRKEEGGYVASTCRPDVEKICSQTTCVSKCCPLGQAIKRGKCIPDNTTFNPLFKSEITGAPLLTPSPLKVLEGAERCSPLFHLHPKKNPEDEFYLLENGYLYNPWSGRKAPPGKYCIDYFVGVKLNLALYCGKGRSYAIEVAGHIMSFCQLVSCIFLAALILCHLLVPKLRDVQGLCHLFHAGSLLLFYAAVLTAYMFNRHITDQHCFANGIIHQFFALSAFLWLNVMCFDIWRVIKGTVNVVPLSEILSNESRQLKLYCLYAWGTTSIFTGVTILLHYLPEDHVAASVIKPDIGVYTCWFSGTYETLSYFYGPVAVLFLINILLLGHTAVMLYRAVKDNKQSTRKHLDAFWQRFGIFCTMAFCWIFEILSWKITPLEIWIPTDIINALQGLILFLIFISSEKKRELLRPLWTTIRNNISEAGRKVSGWTTDFTSGSTEMITDETYKSKSTSGGETETEMKRISHTSATEQQESTPT